MGKDKTMSKSSFLSGALIVTLSIIITKILGVLYVIPFHSVIGDDGGALYGYAYTIYLVFMSLSSLGIPLAISRVVSEYQALGYNNAKMRSFAIGRKFALIMGVVCFIILFLFAPFFAKLILGDLTGGNTIEDITLVVRVISLAILIVPILSIYRGYFEGHRIMKVPSISQVIEQLVRVFVIVVGSFVALKVFKLPLVWAVALAVFGAFLGAVVSFIYLFIKLKHNKSKLKKRIRDVNEPIVTNKEILKKIVCYSIPFIMLDLFKSLYSYVDTTTVIKGLFKYAHFSVSDAEVIMSMLSTWGNKFNMIVLSVSTGIVVSLIPNLTKSILNKDKNDINSKVNQPLSLLLFLTVPMTFGISFLAYPIWNLFYGSSKFGPSVLSYFIFLGFVIGLFTLVISIVQSFKDGKVIFYSLLFGLFLKLFLNVNLISAFYKMGILAYYGVITASIIGYLSTTLICFIVLYFKYNVNYEIFVKNIIDILCGTFLMVIVLFMLKFLVPISSSSRFVSLLIIILYGVVGSVVYFFFSYKIGLLKNIFGNKIGAKLKKEI